MPSNLVRIQLDNVGTEAHDMDRSALDEGSQILDQLRDGSGSNVSE